MLGIDGLTARRRINLNQYVILNVASVEQLIKLVTTLLVSVHIGLVYPTVLTLCQTFYSR